MSDDDRVTPPRPLHYQMKEGFHPPLRTSAIGMYLFLAALFMLFASGLLGYIIIRFNVSSRMAFGALKVPSALWFSTVIVLIASVTVQRAVSELRHERQESFRGWLMATLVLAALFVVIQTPAMATLLVQQQRMRQQKLALYGLIFFLILLHALHVIGGIAALGWTSKRARDGAYDHEHYHPVARVALYWHFLDAVWMAMFFTFILVK